MTIYRKVRTRWVHQVRTMYFGVYKTFKINTLLRGMPTELQNKAIPYYYNNILIRTIVIRTDMIKWGGRPPNVFETEEFIIDGDWDVKYRLPIMEYLYEYPNSRAIFDMFVYGKHYKETKRYQNMLKLLRENKIDDWRLKRCRTEQDIDVYFMKMKSLYETIRTEGYKSQNRLGAARVNDEIGVYIDRHGEFHKLQGSGHHRLAIAKLLNIKNIPVTIRGIHAEWARKCTQKYKTDIITAVSDGISQFNIAN